MMAVIPEIESFADHPMKSATTIKQLDGPIQLIKCKGSGSDARFEVCKEAVEILRGLGNVKLSVITIGGSFRSGKSYLLNLLLDRVQQNLTGFQVGGLFLGFAVVVVLDIVVDMLLDMLSLSTAVGQDVDGGIVCVSRR